MLVSTLASLVNATAPMPTGGRFVTVFAAIDALVLSSAPIS